MSLGDGFNVTIQAYVTTITEPTKAAQICSWMAMLGSAGTIAGRPVMMGVYQYGLRKSNSTHGLPYGLSVVSSPHAIALKIFRLICISSYTFALLHSACDGWLEGPALGSNYILRQGMMTASITHRRTKEVHCTTFAAAVNQEEGYSLGCRQ